MSSGKEPLVEEDEDEEAPLEVDREVEEAGQPLTVCVTMVTGSATTEALGHALTVTVTIGATSRSSGGELGVARTALPSSSRVLRMSIVVEMKSQCFTVTKAGRRDGVEIDEKLQT